MRVEVGERVTGDHLVGQWPAAFGRLQLRGGGGQEGRVDPLGDGQVGRPMPARMVKHQHRSEAGVDTLVAGEFGWTDPLDARR